MTEYNVYYSNQNDWLIENTVMNQLSTAAWAYVLDTNADNKISYDGWLTGSLTIKQFEVVATNPIAIAGTVVKATFEAASFYEDYNYLLMEAQDPVVSDAVTFEQWVESIFLES